MEKISAEPLLRVETLSIRLRDADLTRPVTFSIAPGEAVGLRGATGSGKSTLARAILGFRPEGATLDGTIEFAGRDLRRLSPNEWRSLRGREIALLAQEPALALNPYLTLARQLREHLRAHGSRNSGALERLLPGLLDRHPHQLSGGERQRAALALAVVHGPRLLIADEPTTALDPVTERLVLDFLLELRQTSGMALLVASHDPRVLRFVADRVVELDREC
ncbi:MAG: dipeptide/oligopeptide/nickel ABC transporter ATP-binding protein [Bryobacteraceae bacterium]|nr:dipeptide/oligopeptide/nickel ABC transporter ATP-binding protein [Bryobacteraceae bacterium]